MEEINKQEEQKEEKKDYQSQSLDIFNIQGMVDTVSSVPTKTPTKFSDQVKLYADSFTAPTDQRLYFYSNRTKSWVAYSPKYACSSTNEVISSDTDITITTGFTPKLILLTGIRDGQAKISLGSSSGTTGQKAIYFNGTAWNYLDAFIMCVGAGSDFRYGQIKTIS